MSSRNKTLDFSIEEGAEYLKNAVTVENVTNDIINKCIIGDTFDALKLIKSKSFDLLIVDPPYNLFKDYGETKFSCVSKEKYLDYTKKWINACIPLLKDNASIYVCCDWKCSNEIAEALSEVAVIKNRITWQREKGRGAKSNWKNCTEDIWFAVLDDKNYKFNLDAVKQRRRVLAPYKTEGEPKDWVETKDGKFRDTCPSNFWDDITVPYWSMVENTAHPTQKPEKLIAKLILASSDEGDIILDPFGGALTTAVTAKKLGRNFVTIEMNPQYVAWGEKRLADAEVDKTIQGYDDGVFWERNTRTSAKK